VALYQSVRFRPSGTLDPTTITGSPSELVARLRDLVELHNPNTIGIAPVDGDDVLSMMQRSIETLQHFRG
jgi:alkanesulfonate monooxygenase SsuD/methylene tetrahydromethanopterin reductase-like flavin-dependent oxidoreductase (luciferase family)